MPMQELAGIRMYTGPWRSNLASVPTQAGKFALVEFSWHRGLKRTEGSGWRAGKR